MRNMILRQVKLFLAVLLGYLVQVCVMPYCQVGGITPSLLAVMVAIATVGFGRLRALWVGAFYGIVMETMLPTVPMMNLMLYPVAALLCSVPCADKSAAKLQYERSIGKAGRNISPLLRTVVCALLNALCYEVVNIVYLYLGGNELTVVTFTRAVTAVLATAALAALIMVPVRKLLGFRKPEPENPAEVRFGKPLKLDD